MMRRFLLSFALLVVPLLAHGDWAADRDGSAGYVTVTVLASAVDEAVPFFVVYGSDLPADFHTAMSDASDTDGKTIRVSTADGATQLACVPIGVDTSTDTFALIALGTGMSASVDVDYRIYVGNASLSMPTASGGMGEQAVFASYAGVYFPGVDVRDWTAGGRTLTARGTPGTAASGFEGITAATFNGSNNGYYYDGTQGVAAWPVSMEAIVYSTSNSTVQNPFCLGNSANSQNTALMPFRGDLASPSTDPNEAAFRGNSTTVSSALSSSGYTTSTNHYVAISRSGGTGTAVIYRDGVALGSDSTTINSTFSPNRLSIGYRRYSASDATLNGRVTVALLSDSVRSADFIATSKRNWDGALYSAGAWTALGSCGSGGTGLVLFGSNSQTSTANANWNDLPASLLDDATTTDVSLDDTGVFESETITYVGADLSGVPTDAISYTVTLHIKKKAETGGGKEINDLVVRFRDGSGTLQGDNLAEVAVPWNGTAATVEYPLTGYTPDGGDFTSSTGVDVQATGFDTDGATLAEILTVWIEVDWEGAPCDEGSNWFSMWD